MGLRINQNIAAQNAYRNLSVTDGQMSKSLEKLSSGFRINRAADDAAGLSISEGLRSQIGGLKVATRNSQDGISVVQTAEGALTETHAILQRMRDLTVQASNTGGLSEDAKTNIQNEMTELGSELTRIADTTQYNGTKLLDGTFNGTFQTGANVGEKIDVVLGKSMGAASLKVDTLKVDNTSASWQATAALGSIAAVASGGTVATAASTVTINGGTAIELRAAAAAGVAAAEVTAAEVVTKINAAGQAGVSASLNDAGELVVTTSGFEGTSTVAFGGPAPATGTTEDTAARVVGVKGDAAAALTAIDSAIKQVSTTRSELGAKQNRFEHTINSLNVAVENLSASESRIRDADMAQEMVAMTRHQILSQAGTAMLAQANQGSQGVLQLLR